MNSGFSHNIGRFSFCWTVLTQNQNCHLITPARRLRLHKKLGGDTARTGDSNSYHYRWCSPTFQEMAEHLSMGSGELIPCYDFLVCVAFALPVKLYLNPWFSYFRLSDPFSHPTLRSMKFEMLSCLPSLIHNTDFTKDLSNNVNWELYWYQINESSPICIELITKL